MELSEEQEKYIARYMKDVGGHLESLPSTQRAHCLLQLKSQIHRELLKQFEKTGTSPANEDVMMAVSRSRQILAESLDAKEEEAPKIDEEATTVPVVEEAATVPVVEEAATVPVDGEADESGERSAEEEESGEIWLGVCRHIAQRFGIPVLAVRIGFLVLGVTGPISLFLYLVAFLEMNVFGPKEERAPIDSQRIWKRVLYSLGGTVALYGCVYGLIALSKVIYLRFAQQTLINVKTWGWLDYYQTSIFVGMIALVLPVAILSGLPMSREWDETALKVARACIAIYAFVLSLGMASYGVGLLLVIADRVV